MDRFLDHYCGWRTSRLSAIKKYVDPKILHGKSLLELGCGYSDNGIYFKENYDCKLVASDARPEHLQVVAERYPDVDIMQFDCDTAELVSKFDIILHWGVLYHIRNVDKHLENVCKHCDYLFLETIVLDSTDSNAIHYIEENNYYDQAFNTVGNRCSPAYVERLLAEYGFEYKLILDDILNYSIHNYTWLHNTNYEDLAPRRYWIAWKRGLQSPLL